MFQLHKIKNSREQLKLKSQNIHCKSETKIKSKHIDSIHFQNHKMDSSTIKSRLERIQDLTEEVKENDFKTPIIFHRKIDKSKQSSELLNFIKSRSTVSSYFLKIPSKSRRNLGKFELGNILEQHKYLTKYKASNLNSLYPSKNEAQNSHHSRDSLVAKLPAEFRQITKNIGNIKRNNNINVEYDKQNFKIVKLRRSQPQSAFQSPAKNS